MEGKKTFYWLRLKKGWFEDNIWIRKLRTIAGGDTYTIIYLKLQLLSLEEEGKIILEGIEDDFRHELALRIGEETENVCVAIDYLIRAGLIEVTNDTEVFLPEVPACIGKETDSAKRVREHRRKQQTLQCNTFVTRCNTLETKCNTEIEIEKEYRDIKDINTFARSPDKQASELEENVEALILNDGSEWRPTKALFAEYVRLYPNVDVKQQFNVMRSWCLSNPAKKKTRRGITRFVNSWLAREQDRGYRKPADNVSYKQMQSESGYSQDVINRLVNENRGDLDG